MKVDICNILSLDTRSRVLLRLDNQEKVTLGISACLCLEALIKAKGTICSQNDLLNIGWQSLDIEVTASSLRVVINQLRKALLALRVDKIVTIVTVPRAGYRILVAEEITTLPLAPPSALPFETRFDSSKVSNYSQLKTLTSRRFFTGAMLFITLSIFVAFTLAWTLSPRYWRHLTSIQYVPYIRPELKPLSGDASVFVSDRELPDIDRIRSTLLLWQQNVSHREKWRNLYINKASSRYVYNLIACTRSLKEKQNDCTSFVFKTN